MSVKMQQLCIRYALDITYQMCFCHLLYPEDMALRDAYSHKIDAKFILKLYILKSVIRSLLPYTFILRIDRKCLLRLNLIFSEYSMRW